MSLQSKRTYGIVASMLVLAAFAGCSALGGGSSDGCGPGDTKVEDINVSLEDLGDLEPVTIEGEIVAAEPGALTVDDGTGTAMIVGQRHDFVNKTGTCVTVEATPHIGMWGGSDSDTKVDVLLRSANITET